MPPPFRVSLLLLVLVILTFAPPVSTIKLQTNTHSHLNRNNPTILAALKKSIKISSFPQVNGKPFIPFYSKSQISLLQNQINKECILSSRLFQDLNLKVGTGQFSLNDYLSNKNEFNPQLAEEISEEVRSQFLQQIHEEAESAVLSCRNPPNEFLATVCLMCKTEKAYLLTSENWFTVGLDNNYKDEFAKILNYVQYYIPNVRWMAAFGENNICLGSVDPTENIDIDNVLNSVTSRNTSYYIKPDFVPKIDQSRVNFAAFEYIPLGENHSFIIDLIVNYQQESQLKLSSSLATLDLESIWIRSQEETSFATGLLSIGSVTSIPFTLDLGTSKGYYLIEGDLISKFLPLSSVYNIFNDDTDQLLQTVSLPSVSNLHAFITSKIALRFELTTRQIVQVNVELGKSPNFAITTEFYFIDPKFQIIINLNDQTTTLKVEATAQDVTEQILLQGVLTKTQSEQEEIVLSQLHNPSVQLSVLEKTFQRKDPDFQGFFPSNKIFDNIHHNENFQNLTIKIKPDLTPAYHISSDLSPNSGQFESILVVIGGHVNSKTSITFSQKSLTQFLSVSAKLSDDYFEPQTFTIVHCDHSLDSQFFPQVASLQTGNPYWKKGTTFTYKLSIKDCDETTAFCNVFTNFVSDPTNNIIQLQGTLNDQNIELVSDSAIQNQDIKIGDLVFRDIKLNIGIPLAATADLEIYLTFVNELTVLPDDQKLIFDGKITFDDTNANLYTKSLDTWSSALDLDFLQISGLEIKGFIPSDSFLIQDMKAAGILIWGTQCSDSSTGNFNQERCIYGKSDILLNVQNISKSHAVGVYRGITGSNLLKSLLEGYDENIPKQFTEHQKFLGFAQLKYVPLSTNSVILLQQDELIEAGIFVKGHSELLGIQGETTLELNPWRKNLEGSFIFGPTDVANGNILLKNMPNKMQLKILKENQPGIIQMEGLMKILNFDGKGYWNLSNEETAFTTSITTELFETINIQGLLSDIQDLKTAEINIQGVASPNGKMELLNAKLQQFFDEWTQVVSAQFTKIDNRLNYFKNLTQEKADRLCKEGSCELRNQCSDDPAQSCLQFDTTNVCKNSVEVCTESKMQCTKKTSVVTGNSNYMTKNGPNFLTGACKEYEHQCSGHTQDICQEYETQMVESACKIYGWACQERLVPNPACQSECERKQTEYKSIKKFYEALEDNYGRFNIKTNNLKQFLTGYARKPSVQLINAEFSALLNSFKTSQDLNWHIQYTISNQSHDILVEGIDLSDFNEGVTHIAKAIGVQTAQRYNFKWMDIQEMITYLAQEIKDGIPSSIQFIKLDKM